MWYKDVKQGFGLTLKQWRGKTGISQEELAWRAGLHRSYVADIERGARNASLQSIEKLASALKISLSTLFEPLDEAPQPAQRPVGLSRSQGPVDILLVEDEPSDVELTLLAFQQARLTNRIQVVGDGAEALDFVFCQGAYARCKKANRPKIMLLDLYLPKVQGLEVLRRVKADRRTRHIRVVVLTVSRKDEHIDEAQRLGADAYITKPVDFHRFSEITPRLDFAWTLQPGPTRGRTAKSAAAPTRAI
jgi:CheY-like chemotaxis protein/DNA-binding XRE family transcriptional regulator